MTLQTCIFCFGSIVWILSLALTVHAECSAGEASQDGLRKEFTIIRNLEYKEEFQEECQVPPSCRKAVGEEIQKREAGNQAHSLVGRALLNMKRVVHLLLGVFRSPDQQGVKIKTSKGPIVGLRWNPNPCTKASYDAFLGIPYGQITGRFQPPAPRTRWSTPLITQKDGPACPQPKRPFSEDCLYLNVFTPVAASKTPGKLPVVAFIHGSAFTHSSSNSLVFGPDFIVPQGVILVTMNYRLGAAGFLTLGSSVAPGNLGLLDTQLALRWIQQEISVFGGDPTRVTLAGHSAGSASTMFHYLSPVSSGLFQRAIAHSGFALSTWSHVTSAEAVHRAKLLAEAVGCDTSLDDSHILTCLQQKDINTIVDHQNINLPVENYASGRNLPFVPVIDSSFGNPGFFPDSIENLLKKSVERSKPLMAGFTTEEGIFLFDYDSWKLAECNLQSFIPLSAKTDLSDQQKLASGKKIESKYFPKTVAQNKVLNLVNIYTDYMFAYPAIEVIRQLASVTYGFVFAYQGTWTPIPKNFKRFHVTGVHHGADMKYLFYRGQDLSTCPTNRPNLVVRNNMVRWWTNFIKGGEPDPTGLWTTADKGNYLLIDSTSSIVKASEVEDRYYNFWANLNADDPDAS